MATQTKETVSTASRVGLREMEGGQTPESSRRQGQGSWASVAQLGTMLPVYRGDGSSPTVHEFFKILDQMRWMAGWNDETAIGVAKCKMAGAAFEFSWYEPQVERVRTYDEFKELVISRFDRDPPILKFNKFTGAKQEANEDIGQWATRLQTLGFATLVPSKAGTPGERDRENEQERGRLKGQMLNIFVANLFDPVIRRFVLSRQPQNLEDAIAAARAEEQFDMLVRGNTRINMVTEEAGLVKEVLQRLEALERAQETQAKLLAERPTLPARFEHTAGDRPPPNPRGPCYRCGRNGHIARECRAPRGHEPTYSQRGPRGGRTRDREYTEGTRERRPRDNSEGRRSGSEDGPEQKNGGDGARS